MMLVPKLIPIKLSREQLLGVVKCVQELPAQGRQNYDLAAEMVSFAIFL